MSRALSIALTALAALAGHTARAAAAAASAAAPATHSFAAPDMASGPSPAGLGGLGEVTLALGAVLAAIFALAWLVRRVRVVAGRAEALAVLAEVRIGPKERAVLIKVGAAQLLVGVAPGQVHTLHVLPEPIEVGRAGSAGSAGKADSARSAAPDRPSFRALLLKSLGKS